MSCVLAVANPRISVRCSSNFSSLVPKIMPHRHAKQLEVLQCIFHRSLRCFAMDSHIIKRLQLKGVRVFVRLDSFSLLQSSIVVLRDMQSYRQAFNVRRVKLDPNCFLCAVYFNVRIETWNIINATFIGQRECRILVQNTNSLCQMYVEGNEHKELTSKKEVVTMSREHQWAFLVPRAWPIDREIQARKTCATCERTHLSNQRCHTPAMRS